MIWILKWMFLGHVHNWKTIDQKEFVLTDEGKVVERGARYIQQCEKCGIVVKRDLI